MEIHAGEKIYVDDMIAKDLRICVKCGKKPPESEGKFFCAKCKRKISKEWTTLPDTIMEAV